MRQCAWSWTRGGGQQIEWRRDARCLPRCSRPSRVNWLGGSYSTTRLPRRYTFFLFPLPPLPPRLQVFPGSPAAAPTSPPPHRPSRRHHTITLTAARLDDETSATGHCLCKNCSRPTTPTRTLGIQQMFNKSHSSRFCSCWCHTARRPMLRPHMHRYGRFFFVLAALAYKADQ